MLHYSKTIAYSVPRTEQILLGVYAFYTQAIVGIANTLVKDMNKKVKTIPIPDDVDIQKCLNGDSEAYRHLVDRYQSHIATIMWRFSRNPRTHEELIQDVFVEAYLSLHTYKAQAPFPHWLSRIAIRVGYHFWRHQARQKGRTSLNRQDWYRIADNTIDSISAQEAAALLHRLLAQLPPRDRLVLTLRYIEEKDVSTTARQTGWSKTMVKVQTLRAKKKLEKLLQHYQQEFQS